MMNSSEYLNVMLKALYCEQIIEEACNGNMMENHFRNKVTMDECSILFDKSNELKISVGGEV